ncbi:protein S100-G-like [Amphiprion ocellaris]|uniref:protein S100-G-like n=1 Tax=Amphiprion ocellaris TaxID=80972 RepID=UPI000C3151DF|nr:protein S100-G-like [Amphiprion ocellaris]
MACEEVKEKFKKYAGEDELLSEAEFKKMVENEVGNVRIRDRVLKHASKIIKKRDTDGDGKLSFEEFENCARLMKQLKDKEKKGEPLEDSE